jgi:radical SAM protein with 4Fe4S-binding SPASM domain
MTVSITNACGLNCAHCYSHCGSALDPAELSTGEWLRLIDEAADAGIVALMVEGGEPLLRPDIFDILGHASRKMLVWLRTHALDIDADTARRIHESGVATVCVDVFGASAATHDAHACVAGAFDCTMGGLRALAGAGLDLLPLLILTRRNRHELQAYLDLADHLGANKASILRLYPIGRARANWAALACTRAEMVDAIAGLNVPRGLRLLHSWHPRNGNCCWESSAVTATGVSVGCPYLREFVNFGDVRSGTLLATWDDPLYRALRGAEAGHCHDCFDHEGTRGGCRATAYAFTGDWQAQDPFCPDSEIDLRDLPNRPL